MSHDPDLIRECQQAHGEGFDYLTQLFPARLATLIERRAWDGRKRKGGGTFESFYEFATAPLWWGLGLNGGDKHLSYEDAVRYCAVMRKDVADLLRGEVPELGRPGGDGSNQHAKAESKRANNTVATDRGSTNATYLARRLKRDHPEIAAQLAAGEFPSVRKAAIEAGLIDPQAETYRAAVRALRKLSPEDRRRAIAAADSRSVPAPAVKAPPPPPKRNGIAQTIERRTYTVTPKVMDPATETWLESTLSFGRTCAKSADVDCRRVVEIAAELREHDGAGRRFGGDWARLCREGLGIEPEFLDAWTRGVEILRRDE